MFKTIVQRALDVTFKLRKSSNVPRAYRAHVMDINSLETLFKLCNDLELKEKTTILKQRLLKGEPKSSMVSESFALIREASRRILGFRHYDVQLIAGLVLNDGKIAEMKTGEGKTLVALLPSFLNALYGKGVHVITVNDYLAERDAQMAGQVFRFLGFTVGLIQEKMLFFERQRNYNCDITYLTHAEVGFDYLRDNMVYIPEKIVQRTLFYCLIDEVDSILIDESKTPLIISGSGKLSGLSYRKTAILAKRLKLNVHYLVEEKTQNIRLTTKGYSFCENALQVIDLYDSNTPWISYILNSLKAHAFFELNINYIINNYNEVVIVDDFTGRALPGRRWSAGLHQAVEAKEYLTIQRETKTLASISYQNLFLLYKGLSGMTGTAKTEEFEFRTTYRLKVMKIPTHTQKRRKDLENVVYLKESTKWRFIASECCNFYTRGKPVLIGTTTIANSEVMSAVLLACNIPHKVLNARPENVISETQIIAQAGCIRSITIATNMAGRGTDILLGGNPQFLATSLLTKVFANDVATPLFQTFSRLLVDKFQKIELKRSIALIAFSTFKFSEFKEALDEVTRNNGRKINPYHELYNALFEAQKILASINYNFVVDLGGLSVIGTELHDSRRIDNQLRGRAGRQGDPGSSQFFLSLEESLLLKKFGGANVLEQMKKYGRSELATPLKSAGLTKALKIAQKKTEIFYFDERQNLFKYEVVINLQRNAVYEERRSILSKTYSIKWFLDYGKRICDEVLRNFKHFDFVIVKLQNLLGIPFSNWMIPNILLASTRKYWLYEHVEVVYDLRKSELEAVEPLVIKKFEASIMLQQLDIGWSEHLQKISFLRESTQWRAYGQRNPLTEYKREALQLYTEMLIQNRHKFIFSIMQVRLLF